ncbi:MAG: hypothetical protein WCW66_05440 [Patescibacteria group bacterium]
MAEVMCGFKARVTNRFQPKGCVAFEVRSGALVLDNSTELLFERWERFEHYQSVHSLQINRRPVRVVVAGERCAVLVEGFCDELPPNKSDVFLVNGVQATIGGKGTIFHVYDASGVIAVDLEEGVLCQGDWIVIHGPDGFRHEQIAASIEVNQGYQETVIAGQTVSILIEVDPKNGFPTEGDTVTVVSIKK